MHEITKLINNVNRTHRGLGKMTAANLLAAKARKCILNIAPAGCGKSVASKLASELLECERLDYFKLSLAGLKREQQNLDRFNGVVWIDDLAASGGSYMRTATITALATLAHEHFYVGATADSGINIRDFKGAALMNIQPVLMYQLLQSTDWEAAVRDKTLRYYHFIRPRRPKREAPRVRIKKNRDFDKVHEPKRTGKQWWDLVMIGLSQWSFARCLRHLPDLLKACAAIDNRRDVQRKDYEVLKDILTCMTVEPLLIERYGWETGHQFEHNAYCVLVELASFDKVTINQIATDYHVSKSTAYRLMGTVEKWTTLKANSGHIIEPTELGQAILDKVR